MRRRYGDLPQEEREAAFLRSLQHARTPASYVSNGVRIYNLTRERARELAAAVAGERRVVSRGKTHTLDRVLNAVRTAYIAGLSPQLAGQLLTDLLQAQDSDRE